MSKKTLLITFVSLCLALVCAVGYTLAFIIDKTEPVVNIFTVGDINIGLDESDDLDLKMVPGKVITKDPVVTVEAGSEACWLFVKVEESDNFDDFMTYAIATGWTALANNDGVYYREVAATTEDTSFSVLANDKVTVKETVTKADLNALTEDPYPTLTFTAYAVQKDNVADAATAWGKINPTT